MKLDWQLVLGGISAGLQPVLPYLVPLVLLIAFVTWPMPGRGPGFLASRDVWRGFKFEPRRVVSQRIVSGFRLQMSVRGRISLRGAIEVRNHDIAWSRPVARRVSDRGNLATSRCGRLPPSPSVTMR